MKNIPDFNFNCSKDGTPFLSAKDIDSHATAFLQEYAKSHSEYSFLVPQPTPIDEIIESHCGLSMDFQDFAEKDVLGMTSFSSGFINIIRDNAIVPYKIEKGTIVISAELEADEKLQGRLRYTMAHELGHNVYHRKKFEVPDYSNQPSLFDEEPKKIFAITCHRDSIENLGGAHEKDWIEWQADYFASCLLMPKEAVAVFWKVFSKETDFVFWRRIDTFFS